MLTKEEVTRKLGIENLSQTEQDEQLQQLADTVSSRLLQKLTEKLSDEDLNKLAVLIDDQKDDEVASYLRNKIEDYDSWNAKIELDTINELENNRKAIVAEMGGMEHTTAPTD
jgi:hypothetical protein